MRNNYVLSSGQINFKNTDQTSAYSCVVIKDGEFHNLTEPLREQLIKKLQSLSPEPEINFEDML